LLILMVVLMLVGLPIYLSIGVPTALYFLIENPTLMLMLPQRMCAGADSFPLLAIPFFILCGEVMNAGGLTDRLFGFARKIIGFIPGGLGFANVVASCLFASMSGSAVADTAGLGRIEMQAMEEAGYDRDFSIGITVASSTIGPIIPPSINMVLYGAMAGASTSALFIGGVVPGILMGLSMCVLVYIISRKRNYPTDPVPKLIPLLNSFKDAVLALFTPVIIIGGMMSGIFTATEASMVACLYSLFICALVYRQLTWKGLLDAARQTIHSTGTIMLIIAVASAFSYMLSLEQIPQKLSYWILGLSTNTNVIWLLLIVLFLIIGCFMEVSSAIIVLTPILLPAVKMLGFDLVHFGVVMVLALGVGLITPPMGMCLYVGANVSNLPLSKVIRATAPYIIPITIVVLLCTYCPSLILWPSIG